MRKFIHGLLNILLFPFKIIMLFSLINLQVEIESFKSFNCKKLDKIMEEVMFK